MTKKKTPKTSRIVWFAAGGGIAKMGPYETQIAATNALRLGDDRPTHRQFPKDAFVWPEEWS